MKITRDEIIHVANLARLTFEEEEQDRITAQINDVLMYVEKLQELDTEGVEPTSHALELTNAFRNDEVFASLDVDAALANAPQKEDDAFVVPRII